ncbi:hypothetical protein N7478_006003 [Penicillium angulare]|uniref:uncharacterized protein n=1 Tax=Penicillium angulare TaxID=116970 RepID=UPI00253F7E85|nr:uncharacterized protein N7478_006003 [Penicillium angulare]KAJ5280631.1 hypothetical protein N7478_006003 [Penicillium angulare]
MMKSTLRLDYGTISGSVRGIETKFTITQDEAYDYKIAHDDFDPDIVFPQMMQVADQLQDILQSSLSSEQETACEKHILECLTRMVYGSNMIEHAGAGLEITWKLCMKVFKGEPVLEDIGERDEDRREIIQHAKAAAFMITECYLHDKELSQEIILETHRILCYKVDAESAPWETYSGAFRSVDVSAGFHTFPPPKLIPSKMKDMIHQLDSDLKQACQSGDIGPVMLSAKYTHIFVNIHPFLDGNGRLCRLILNTMLLKYGSFIISLGGYGKGRQIYNEVAANESTLEDTYDGREEEKKPVMHKELASLVLSHAKLSLGKLIKAISK